MHQPGPGAPPRALPGGPASVLGVLPSARPRAGLASPDAGCPGGSGLTRVMACLAPAASLSGGLLSGRAGTPEVRGPPGHQHHPRPPGRGAAGSDLRSASWAPGGLPVQGTHDEPSAGERSALSRPSPHALESSPQTKPLHPHSVSGFAFGLRAHVATHLRGHTHASGRRVHMAEWVTLPTPPKEEAHILVPGSRDCRPV